MARIRLKHDGHWLRMPEPVMISHPWMFDEETGLAKETELDIFGGSAIEPGETVTHDGETYVVDGFETEENNGAYSDPILILKNDTVTVELGVKYVLESNPVQFVFALKR